MNKRIKKLTPKILKQIILEEKRNVRKMLKLKKNKAKKRKKSTVKNEITYLNETKKRQEKLVREFKKLFLIRKKLKRNLIKRL
tara:strand:- start:49 stop:297 length:249 start_codon:yes stop_codon:yes gene_type:complete